MSYKIIITETRRQTGLTSKEWKIINKDGDYGYTPQEEENKVVEIETFRQTVDELSLSNVIKAINNI